MRDSELRGKRKSVLPVYETAGFINADQNIHCTEKATRLYTIMFYARCAVFVIFSAIHKLLWLVLQFFVM